jgi:hypothetical protein
LAPQDEGASTDGRLTIAWWAREAAVARDRCDVPIDVDLVADAAHEGGEAAAVVGVDDQPAGLVVAGGAVTVCDAGWCGDEAAGRSHGDVWT